MAWAAISHDRNTPRWVTHFNLQISTATATLAALRAAFLSLAWFINTSDCIPVSRMCAITPDLYHLTSIPSCASMRAQSPSSFLGSQYLTQRNGPVSSWMHWLLSTHNPSIPQAFAASSSCSRSVVMVHSSCHGSLQCTRTANKLRCKRARQYSPSLGHPTCARMVHLFHMRSNTHLGLGCGAGFAAVRPTRRLVSLGVHQAAGCARREGRRSRVPRPCSEGCRLRNTANHSHEPTLQICSSNADPALIKWL